MPLAEAPVVYLKHSFLEKQAINIYLDDSTLVEILLLIWQLCVPRPLWEITFTAWSYDCIRLIDSQSKKMFESSFTTTLYEQIHEISRDFFIVSRL